MATITAQQIIDRAEKTLNDDTNVRWASDELLTYLNDGQREIVLLKPNAYVRNLAVQLVAGTKQSVPNDGVWLNRVVRNMGAAGATPGRAVTEVDMDMLDLTRPDWHAETTSTTAQHFMFDPNDPKNYYITPPQPAVTPSYVEISYSAAPPEVVISAVISLDDIYETPLYYYVLSRAYAKSTQSGNDAKAAGWYSLFVQALGVKSATEKPKAAA